MSATCESKTRASSAKDCVKDEGEPVRGICPSEADPVTMGVSTALRAEETADEMDKAFPGQIIAKLGEADAPLAAGATTAQVVQKL